MPTSTTQIDSAPDCDIFCAVIDNYGDIGVCWRLARQLAKEHGLHVRLWVDQLSTFQVLCPAVQTQSTKQRIENIDIRLWPQQDSAELFSNITPASLVIEAFACRIPEAFIARMAQSTPPPVWINLEYLSAEDWVATCHRLPSPQPQLSLVKYFFFPGFTPETGGLLRENSLLSERQKFLEQPGAQNEFWRALGVTTPPQNALRVSLFSYENAAIAQLLKAWETAEKPVYCLLPPSRALPAVEAYYQQKLTAGDVIQRGALELHVIPFLEHKRYDQLLWACDLNFVRGEDSFVRAQWAARPFVWHIYPQEEDAHRIKLDAFLQRYCAGLGEETNAMLRTFWHSWNNTNHSKKLDWDALSAALPKLTQHTKQWLEQLAKTEDLACQLVRFTRSH
ncbi:MAG: elongation factor P maturation arginine rhamnosyltransferase EarP [Pseudomonadota bacterium]